MKEIMVWFDKGLTHNRYHSRDKKEWIRIINRISDTNKESNKCKKTRLSNGIKQKLKHSKEIQWRLEIK